ncbi:MAG: hypothetical protein R3C17_02920 [Planctomycetaceae bacterium]
MRYQAFLDVLLALEEPELTYETKSGDRHNVTVTRLYRDGDFWCESQLFGRDDRVLLAKALDQAHTWIMQQGTVSEPVWQSRPKDSYHS